MKSKTEAIQGRDTKNSIKEEEIKLLTFVKGKIFFFVSQLTYPANDMHTRKTLKDINKLPNIFCLQLPKINEKIPLNVRQLVSHIHHNCK